MHRDVPAPSGEITAIGAVPRSQFKREVLPIAGGTGRYAGVRGEVVTILKFHGMEHDNLFTFHLR